MTSDNDRDYGRFLLSRYNEEGEEGGECAVCNKRFEVGDLMISWDGAPSFAAHVDCAPVLLRKIGSDDD